MSFTPARIAHQSLAVCALAVCLALPASFSLAADPQLFRELLEMSRTEKKGLTFYVNGQVIAGGVIRITEDAVEIKNREFGRIIIRLDRIDAVAAN